MHIKKYFKTSTLYLAMAAFITVSFLSCSDDDEPTLIPQLPALEGSRVIKIEHNGKYETCYDWDFQYDSKRLYYAKGTLRDNTDDNTHKKSYSSRIKYGNQSVSVTNSDNRTVKIKLNNLGLIEHMSIGDDTYNFAYIDERLTSWRKVLHSNSFGQMEKFEYSGQIRYEEGDYKSIVVVGPNEIPITTSFIPDTIENKNGLLPEAIGDATGCFGFEHLYYAGLLGRPTRHLVKCITMENPKDTTENHRIIYDYSIKNNNTELCNYKNITNGKTVSVLYSYQ